MAPTLTRFAPSPTGWLHLGHAYAALRAYLEASSPTHFYLRLDDLDQTRARPHYEDALLEDLAWLGLTWNPKIRRQSEHFQDYTQALQQLQDLGLVYPCFCTRKEIQEEIARAGHAPHGPSGVIYPGTCKRLSSGEVQTRLELGKDFSLRLDLGRAWELGGHDLTWTDLSYGTHLVNPSPLGDVVLARKETPTSYHLAVVLDDQAQGITRVTRGSDLLHATPLHRLLQALLHIAPPVWNHHGLVSDENGVRLAKSSNASSLRALKDSGWTRNQVLEHLSAQMQDSLLLDLRS